MTPRQIEALRRRFRHFDPERAAPLFHEDQPGTVRVKGSAYPAVLMRNDVAWLYDREDRPEDTKTKAPKGPRKILTDDPALSGDQLYVVEGEADAVALLSIGVTGVVAIGGAQGTKHAKALGGKRLYLLFDGDDKGKKGAAKFARAAREADAQAVYVVELPGGMDPEEYAASKETAEEAHAAILALAGAASAKAAADPQGGVADDVQPSQEPVFNRRIFVSGDRPALLQVVADERTGRMALAVYAPRDVFEPEERPYPESPPDRDAPYVFRVVDSLHLPDQGIEYVPKSRGRETEEAIQQRRFAVPPLVEYAEDVQAPSTRELFDAIRAFLAEWVVPPYPEALDACAAYVLASWWLKDKEFDHAGIIYLKGESGTGKNQLGEPMRLLACGGVRTGVTADNMHWVIREWEVPYMFLDEMSFDEMPLDARRKLEKDLLTGTDRLELAQRVIDKELRGFPLFCPKVLAGGSYSTHPMLVRRTLVIEMRKLKPTELPDRLLGMVEFPPSMYERAAELRAKLLRWRCSEFLTPKRETGPENPVSRAAHAALGREIVQKWWFLLHLGHHPDMEEPFQRILNALRSLRERGQEIDRTDPKGILFREMVDMVEDGTAWLIRGERPAVSGEVLVSGVMGVPAKELTRRVQEQLRGITEHDVRCFLQEIPLRRPANGRDRCWGVALAESDHQSARRYFRAWVQDGGAGLPTRELKRPRVYLLPIHDERMAELAERWDAPWPPRPRWVPETVAGEEAASPQGGGCIP